LPAGRAAPPRRPSRRRRRRVPATGGPGPRPGSGLSPTTSRPHCPAHAPREICSPLRAVSKQTRPRVAPKKGRRRKERTVCL
jgi:hypothetical protein